MQQLTLAVGRDAGLTGSDLLPPRVVLAYGAGDRLADLLRTSPTTRAVYALGDVLDVSTNGDGEARWLDGKALAVDAAKRIEV